MTDGPNRDQIRTEYVAGTASLRDLASKYGLAASRIREWSAAEGWVAERKKHRDRVHSDVMKKAQKRAVNALDVLLQAAERTSTMVAAMTNDPDVFRRYVSLRTKKSGGDTTTEMVEDTFERVDMAQVKAFADGLRILTDVVCKIGRVPTQAEEQAQKVAAERLQLERDKFEAEKNKDSTDNVTVRMEIPEGFDA